MLISACVFWACRLGEGDRDNIPEATEGLPRERRTVSNVRSIFRKERVKISCFLGLQMSLRMERVAKASAHLVDRLPRFDSSKIHSWLPVWHLLQGGPFSAPTHFIFKRRQTVQALETR